MALREIPVLPEDYPLFDWADWPDSKAALIQGGPTRDFEMACWNDIVQTLVDALEEGGEEWDPNGIDYYPAYTVDQTKITDGDLHGYQFNRVIANIHNRVPLYNWKWLMEEDYRGYIGRLMVYERISQGQDYVYPEYFEELVHRLNQMLEIMRGTWPIADLLKIPVKSSLTVKPGLRAGRSAPIIKNVFSKTKIDSVAVRAVRHRLINQKCYLNSKILSSVGLLHAKPVIFPSIKLKHKVKAMGEVKRSGKLAVKPFTAHSSVKALVEILNLTDAGSKYLSKTRCIGKVELSDPVSLEGFLEVYSWAMSQIALSEPLATGGSLQMKSKAQADTILVPPMPVELFHKSDSLQSTELFTAIPMLTDIKRQSKSRSLAEGTAGIAISGSVKRIGNSQQNVKTDLSQSQPVKSLQKSAVNRGIFITQNIARPAWAEKNAAISTKVSPELLPTAAVKAGHTTKSKLVCSLDTAWLPPVWINGGLWIRQAYQVKRNEDGSLEVS